MPDLPHALTLPSPPSPLAPTTKKTRSLKPLRSSGLADEGEGHARRWLDAEIDRVWLLAEGCLRRRPGLGAAGDALLDPDLLGGETLRLLTEYYAERGSEPPSPTELRRLLDERQAGIAELRARAPIGRLIANLRLSPLEVELYTIALAPHVEPRLAELYSLLQRSYSRQGVDLALVAQLLGLARAARVALLGAVDPSRPLVALRLLSVDATDSRFATYHAVRPALDLLGVLCGEDALSPQLRQVASLITAPDHLDDLLFDEPARVTCQRLCQRARRGLDAAQPWLVLCGPHGVGKATLAARVAAYAGRPLLCLDTDRAAPGDGDELLRRAQRDALLHDAVLYIGGTPDELLANQGRELGRRLRGCPVPVVIGVVGSAPPVFELGHAVEEVVLPLPGEATRRELWRRALPELADTALLDELARSFSLGPGEIGEVASEALALIDDGGPELERASELERHLRASLERRLRNSLGEFARRMAVACTWDDLVLPPELSERVQELIARHAHADQVYRQWRVAGATDYGKGLVALFSGPPGTGKTMLAGLVAKELGYDLYRVDLSQVVSKWVGETEKQLARVFDLAEHAHAVLLFDEADALLASRTKVESANDRHANLAVNYLLQRFEQFRGVAILTTNKANVLDEAMSRRLSFHLRFRVPEREERERLWRAFLPDELPGASALDHARLAEKYELTGGHIKNVAVRAAFLAAGERRPLDVDLVHRAARLELEDLGRIL